MSNNIFINKDGCLFEILEDISWDKVKIRFESGYQTITRRSHVKSGEVRDVYYKSVYGVGYLGEGIFKTNHNNVTYGVWRNLLRRCYNEKEFYKYSTYIGCSVAEEWHNFQNFAQWYEDNYNPEYMDGWHLDKDILVKGNKIYSPETCCFVHRDINILFRTSSKIHTNCTYNEKIKKYVVYFRKNYLGVSVQVEDAFKIYKEAKEKHIREVADKWKGKITERVYQAMYNYQVEINLDIEK